MLVNELRWILIGFGIVLLAVIYLWGRRRDRKAIASQDAVVRVHSEPPALRSREQRDAGSGDIDPVRDAAFDPESGHAVALAGFDASSAIHESLRDSTRESITTAIRPVTPAGVAAKSIPAQAPPLTGAASSDTWRGRLEPTLSDAAPTEELPVRPQPGSPVSPAPTLSSSETPQPRRIERRKILSLRLATAPQRLEGTVLLEILHRESLQHGKYDVFHRLHTDGVSIFSIASMVEPGTFDLEKMPETQYPGITLFAQLPGPVPGMHALNELVACARRLQQSLGGTLQDDRGVPLTVHRIERLRQEVREFERPPAAGGRGSPASQSTSL